ncbi:AraC family transcriptional regulator [Klebsiella pneumoniae]|nr:AraC family transcriptional regulator [Klebsiella pneumoniae]
MMSDLFKRQHGVTPRQYREQHPLELARPRPPQADRWQPVGPTGCMRDSMSRNHATGKVPPCRSTHRRPGRSICAIVQRAP